MRLKSLLQNLKRKIEYSSSNVTSVKTSIRKRLKILIKSKVPILNVTTVVNLSIWNEVFVPKTALNEEIERLMIRFLAYGLVVHKYIKKYLFAKMY